MSSQVLYLEGGKSNGLAVGMRLQIKRAAEGEPLLSAPVLAAVIVVAVASNSAACEFVGGQDIRVGDMAQLLPKDREALARKVSSENSSKYAQVVTFTEENILEAEKRESIPRPPLPEVNRLNGSISFEYGMIRDRASPGSNSSQEGVSLRADMTRLGGTFWNFTGYWRGRRTTRASGARTETLSDLLNRTYHIGFRYNKPGSRYTAGAGRLLLPWASSLSTIDGGYLGRMFGRSTTLGMFGGATPDPTAWNFDPGRQIFGVFSNVEKGSFESLRYSGTAGVAQTRLQRRPERHFAFLENSVLLGRALSVYHNLEADYKSRELAGNSAGRIILSRSFLTFRVQPHERISLDLNHNYFQSVPTSDPRLASTGLLDQILFEGLNGGVRLKPVRPLTLYSSVGRSIRKGDARPSWNHLYGLTVDRIPLLGLRADLRTSRFNSSFGSGTYYSASLIRRIGGNVQFEVQGGQQRFHSGLTGQNRSRWVNANLDWFFGAHYVMGAGLSLYRGQVQNYDQMFFSLGYRF